MEEISVSLVEIIVFDFIIKQWISSAGLGVHFPGFGSLIKSWLSRCELAQQENRLMIPGPSSGTSLFPARPHPHHRTTTLSRTPRYFQSLISLNTSSALAQAPPCWKDSQVCEPLRRQNSKAAPYYGHLV